MNVSVRRSVGIALLLSLMLAISGVAAPAGLARGAYSHPQVAGIAIDSKTIPELQTLMNQRRLSSLHLTLFYLHRIWKLDRKLNSVIRVNPRAVLEAIRADKARRHGDHRPLLGIPIILKDNINTDHMPTTAGSWALAGSRPRDAFIVKRLKAAGAIILAKANLSEWANFRSIPSSSGWSGIGGQNNSAYVLDRNPCGSSSGSAVAVSASLAVAAVGTETDGSIVCPSGANSLVGIKPTVGLLSRGGIIPISADQDTAGPMARNVTDAAVLLGAMKGVDPTDSATFAQSGNAFRDYTPFLDEDALEGARIGVWRQGGGFGIDPQVDAIMEDAIAAMEAAGAVIVDPVQVPIEEAFVPEFDALLCEFKADLPAYLETYTADRYPKTLQDVIDFNEAHPSLEGPWNSEIFEIAQATNGRDEDCAEVRQQADSIAHAAMDGALADHDLDAIVAPTNGPAWVTDPVNGDLGGDFSNYIASSTPAAITGYASISVPAGYVDEHLPIGISFMAGAWDEPNLIALAYSFEQATQVRKPPQLLLTLE